MFQGHWKHFWLARLLLEMNEDAGRTRSRLGGRGLTVPVLAAPAAGEVASPVSWDAGTGWGPACCSSQDSSSSPLRLSGSGGSVLLFWWCSGECWLIWGQSFNVYSTIFLLYIKNSAALLWKCTDSTDTQDIEQLYQIIYFYNSHFRTLLTPYPTTTTTNNPPSNPPQRSFSSCYMKTEFSFYLLTTLILPFLANLWTLAVICPLRLSIRSTNCPRPSCPSSANKDKSRTAGMQSREVTETRRTNVNPHKVQHNISDSVYLCSSSCSWSFPSPAVGLLQTFTSVFTTKWADNALITFICLNESFNERFEIILLPLFHPSGGFFIY